MEGLLFKDEVYTIVGLCIEVWKNLGYGFSEVVYKDAMDLEFKRNIIPYIREAELLINYKGVYLNHKFKVDFILFDGIIVEVKSCEEGINGKATSQTLNYIKASGFRLGLIINFGRNRMEYKRLII